MSCTRDMSKCSMPECYDNAAFSTDKGWAICRECSKSVIQAVKQDPEIKASVKRMREDDAVELQELQDKVNLIEREAKHLRTRNQSLSRELIYLDNLVGAVGYDIIKS